VERAAEPERHSHTDATPVTKEQRPQKAATKVKRKKQRAQPKAITPAPTSRRPVRDRMPVNGVLAAQFSTPQSSASATAPRAILYLALALAAVLGMVLGLAAAAPLLAGRWPQVFVPVIDATERIVLAGVCLAGAALTLAITWALTGPAA
jgi:hypothetical protein